MTAWTERRLLGIAEVILGRQRSPEHDAGPHMVPYLRAANVKPGHLDLDDVKAMNFTPREQRVFALREGDVLVTEGSGSLSSVGASSQWPCEEADTICFQNTLLRLRARSGVDARWLHWWAQHAFASGLFAAVATGANIYHLSAERVRTLAVALPPLDEQRRIADFLDTETTRLDHLLEVRAVQSQRLSERRSSLLLALVGGTEGGRAPSGLEWLPTVPDHWSTVRLSLVARLGSGHTPSRSHPEWWLDPTIPWITTGEVAQLRDDRLETLTETRELISELGLANSAAEVRPRGTVALSRTASVGFSGVMGLDMATSQDFATWTCGPRLNPYFLLWVLRAMRPWLVGARAIGSTHKTIYMPEIQALRIPLPPLAEQATIVDSIRSELRHLDQVHDVLDSQATLLRERRQALITAAVTGQLDVTTTQQEQLD